jgi:fatty acid-binding protein DegV
MSLVLTTIKQHDLVLHSLLLLLIQQKKLTKKSVKMLKALISSSVEMVQPFVINSPSEKVNTALEKEFKQQFKKADFSSSLSEEIGVQVKRGALSFERNLTEDLEKLLG